MFDEAWVEVSGGNLVRLPELSARLAVGEKGTVSGGIPLATPARKTKGISSRFQDILPQPMSTVQGIFGFLLGSMRPNVADTVVSVKHTVLAVAWLAINQVVCFKHYP